MEVRYLNCILLDDLCDFTKLCFRDEDYCWDKSRLTLEAGPVLIPVFQMEDFTMDAWP